MPEEYKAERAFERQPELPAVELGDGDTDALP